MWSIFDTAKLVELVAGELCWAPGLLPKERPASVDKSSPNAFYTISLADFSDDRHLKGGRYSVAHYPKQAQGDAFGPLAIDQVLAFCGLLGSRVKEYGRVAVATPAGDSRERANVAVMLGAYLLIFKSWSVEKLLDVLKGEAKTAFKRCWQEPMHADGNSVSIVRVKHCWLGIAIALEKGLLSKLVVDNNSIESYCDAWRQILMQYDCCWFAHAQVIVGADPMTVIYDPNKVTCSALTPVPHLAEQLSEEGMEERKDEATDGRANDAGGSASTRPSTGAEQGQTPTAAAESPSAILPGASTGLGAMSPPNSRFGGTPSMQGAKSAGMRTGSAASAGAPSPTNGANMSPSNSEAGMNGISSVHSACKVYGSPSQASPSGDFTLEYPPPLEFTTFCKGAGVTLVVRANKEDEPGLKEIGGSYSADLIEAEGIKHVNAPFKDTHGAVPTGATVKGVMQECEAANGAVFFHCKGGFGRSVVLACCFLIYKHDAPGESLLGWCRMARPGAITTRAQEEFLCGLHGRNDLERYMNGASLDAGCCTIL